LRQERGVPNRNIALQRAQGRAEVAIGPSGRLAHLYQRGCARVLMPRSFVATPLAVVLNTSGGLTGGDVFAIRVDVAPKAGLCVTTQAAERIYCASSGQVEIGNEVNLAAGASLDWLPQETILFDGASMARDLAVEMENDARFLGLEVLVLGRRAMGERFMRGEIRDNWRIRRGGRLLHAEGFRLAGNVVHASARKSALADARALATLVYVAPDAEARLAQARALLGVDGGVTAAASAWEGKLVLRFMAADAQPLRKALTRFLAEFRGHAVPQVWQI